MMTERDDEGEVLMCCYDEDETGADGAGLCWYELCGQKVHDGDLLEIQCGSYWRRVRLCWDYDSESDCVFYDGEGSVDAPVEVAADAKFRWPAKN